MLLPPRRKLLWPISLSPELWTWAGTITGSFLQQESVVAPRISGAGLPKEAHHQARKREYSRGISRLTSQKYHLPGVVV